MKIQKTLEEYGLTKKQASLYLACLSFGSASVYKIAQKAGLPRATSYTLLEELKEKQLVSIYKKRNIIYYSAENPQGMIEQTKEKVRLLENALPELRAMYSTIKDKPMVRQFEGTDGMKTILKEITSEAKEIKGFSSAENMFSIIEDYWPVYLKERIKNKIPAKILLSDSPKARERQRLGSQHLREVRLLPPKYKPDGLIVVWNDKVATFSFGEEMVAMIITNKELAQTKTMMFDFIWDKLSEVKQTVNSYRNF